MRNRSLGLAIIALALQILPVNQSYAAVGDTDTALTWNGTSNYLSVTDTAFGYRSAFTIQAWIRPTATTCSVTACTIFSHDADYILSIANGTFQLWQYYNVNQITPQTDTGIAAKANEWQHIAYTYSSGTQKIYLNGQLVWQNTIAGWTSNPTGYSNYPFKLGYHYGTSYFTGQMDEVRLYSTTRTETEIAGDLNQWGPNNATGLVAYYDMNEVSGSTVLNKVSGAGSNTTLTMSGTLSSFAIESTTTTAGSTTVVFSKSYLNSNGGYKIPLGVSSVQALVVGGGGGGGMDGGGGGGGGGVYQNSSLSVTPNSTYEVDVGVGGRGGKGYTGGSSFCNGVWSTTVVGCNGGTGVSSKFGAVTSSGGGGGGGIESNGAADSDSAATVRGGGGGAGGQNSRSGGATPGVGATSGGSTSDVNSNTGGGGGSTTNAGGNGTTTVAGNGGAGTTATIDSQVYGSGGAGGNFTNATLATGGTNAANGGTSTVAPTNPVANKGGGGAGGGNGGSTVSNSYGTAGASGIIIIKFANRAVASLSYSGTPTYRAITAITATTNTAAKVTFYANGKRIGGCISLSTSANTATCNWKPALHGAIDVSVQVNPIDSNYSSTRSDSTRIIPANRANTR